MDLPDRNTDAMCPAATLLQLLHGELSSIAVLGMSIKVYKSGGKEYRSGEDKDFLALFSVLISQVSTNMHTPPSLAAD